MSNLEERQAAFAHMLAWKDIARKIRERYVTTTDLAAAWATAEQYEFACERMLHYKQQYLTMKKEAAR
jgi:hypothetical protein